MKSLNLSQITRCKQTSTDGLIWFGAVFPKRKILYNEEILDFTNSWDSVVESFHKQIDCGVSRPLIVERHGFDNSKGMGIVEATKVISAEEASAYNLSAEVDGIYLGVRELYAGSLEGVQYVSLGMRFDVMDETGGSWPVFIDEVTATATPHIAIDQTPSLYLSEVLGGNMVSEVVEEEVNKEAPVEMAKQVEPEVEPEVQLADSDRVTKLESQLSEALAMVEALKAKLEESEVERELDNELESENLEVDDEQYKALTRLYKVDKGVVKLISSVKMAKRVEDKNVQLSAKPRKSVGHSSTPLTQLQELAILRERRAAGLSGVEAHAGFNYNEVK